MARAGIGARTGAPAVAGAPPALPSLGDQHTLLKQHTLRIASHILAHVVLRGPMLRGGRVNDTRPYVRILLTIHGPCPLRD